MYEGAEVGGGGGWLGAKNNNSKHLNTKSMMLQWGDLKVCPAVKGRGSTVSKGLDGHIKHSHAIKVVTGVS